VFGRRAVFSEKEAARAATAQKGTAA